MGKGTKQGAQGTSMGGLEQSPKARARAAKRRRRQDAAWARQSGPVTIRQMTPDEQAGRAS